MPSHQVTCALTPADPIEAESEEGRTHFINTVELVPSRLPSSGFSRRILLESRHTSPDDYKEYPGQHELVIRDDDLGQLRVSVGQEVFVPHDTDTREVFHHASFLEVVYEVVGEDRIRSGITGVTAERTHFDVSSESNSDNPRASITFGAAMQSRIWRQLPGLPFHNEELIRVAYRTAAKRYHDVGQQLIKKQ